MKDEFLLSNSRIFVKHKIEDVRGMVEHDIFSSYRRPLPNIDFTKITKCIPTIRTIESPPTVDDTNNSLEYVSDDSGVDMGNILPSIWSSSDDEI